MAVGAVVNMVDQVAAAVMTSEGHDKKPSVNISIAFLSRSKRGDELEIKSKVLGNKGGCTGTTILKSQEQNLISSQELEGSDVHQTRSSSAREVRQLEVPSIRYGLDQINKFCRYEFVNQTF